VIAEDIGLKGGIARVLKLQIDPQKQPREVRSFFMTASKCPQPVSFLYDLLARFVSILARTLGFVVSVDQFVQ
jgi:hypothetical protein